MRTTSIWGIPVPDSDDDPDAVPTHLGNAIDVVDGLIANHKHGTLSARPAPSKANTYYFVDSGPSINTLWFDTGTQWRQVVPSAGTTSDVTTAGFADAPFAGIKIPYAPIDHLHGMPANPMIAHLAASNPHPQYALAATTKFMHQIKFNATGDWVVPAGVAFIKTLVCGGGSSGAVAGATGTGITSPGGGSGQLWVWKIIPVVPLETLHVVLGNGGAAPTAPSADGIMHANDGQDTTITGSVSGLLLTAKGGVKPWGDTRFLGAIGSPVGGVPGGVPNTNGARDGGAPVPPGFGGNAVFTNSANGGPEQYPGLCAGGGSGIDPGFTSLYGVGGGPTGGNGGGTGGPAATPGAPNSGSGGGGYTSNGVYPATAAAGGSGYCEFEAVY